jgi:NAD(P)-dependent dehydrogenase (short-subunit alcohol dehydrogenase family)
MSASRIALITGASKGLGRAAAIEIASRGVTVVLAARDASALASVVEHIHASGGKAEAIILDVCDENSIRDAVQHVDSTYGVLDILLNNAGVGLEGDWVQSNAETVSQEILHKTFETNFFAQVAVTQAFLPLIRRSQHASIVFVGSILGSLTLHASDSGLAGMKTAAYNSSKSALHQYALHLADALADTSIKVNIAHPGWVRTALGSAIGPLSIEEGIDTIVDTALIGPDAPSRQFLHKGEQLPW